MDKPLMIKDTDLETIKDFARQAFRSRSSFSGLSTGEVQAYCIIAGLECFLRSRSVDPGYTLEGYVQEDSEPIAYD